MLFILKLLIDTNLSIHWGDSTSEASKFITKTKSLNRESVEMLWAEVSTYASSPNHGRLKDEESLLGSELIEIKSASSVKGPSKVELGKNIRVNKSTLFSLILHCGPFKDDSLKTHGFDVVGKSFYY